MDLIAYLRTFRRRWIFLVVPVVGAIALAWVTLPDQDAAPTQTVTSYDATATLILDTGANATGQSLNLSTVSVFATIGDVPVKAAKALKFAGEPQVLASLMTVTPQAETNTVTISSSDSDAKTVQNRVNAFATATTDYFRDRDREDARTRVKALQDQLDTITVRLRANQRQLGPDADPVLKAQQESLQEQYSAIFSQVGDLNRILGSSGPLSVLQPAVAIPKVTGGGFTTPTSPFTRLGIAAALGLLLGAGVALLIERVDSRLRTREEVEDSFGLPVLAEIPPLPVTHRNERRIVSEDLPASSGAEAYRKLRSAVLLLGSDQAGGKRSSRAGHGLVIMVTSALPEEGKTTTVANLATVMAEAGRSVAVLSMDLRHPRIHEHFGIDNGTGISDLLGADRGQHIEQVLRDTRVTGVRIATSGERLDHPGALLASVGPMLEAARNTADIVLVDSAPLLAVSDSVDLARHIDVALLVSRLNKTTTAQAAAAQRLLSRLNVPALGTVLIGTRPAGTYGSYLMPALATKTNQASVQPSTTDDDHLPGSAR